jgi:hypothetical protein
MRDAAIPLPLRRHATVPPDGDGDGDGDGSLIASPIARWEGGL